MEDTTETLEKDISWIKAEIKKPSSVLHRIYSSKTPKKDLLLWWGYKLEQLYGLGKYPHELWHISTTIKDDLRTMGLENSIPYVHDVLPFKYKNATKDTRNEHVYSEVHPRTDSSKKLDPSKANANYIKMIVATIKALALTKKSLERKFILEPNLDPLWLEEYFLRWENEIKRLQEILDGREKVPPTTMHILIECLATTTLSDTYAKYIHLRKEEAPLTPKQTGKIVKGRVSKMTHLFEPKNRRQAISAGFYGQQCENCGSWRTEKKLNSSVDKFQLFCFSKAEWTKLKTEKIMLKDRG